MIFYLFGQVVLFITPYYFIHNDRLPGSFKYPDVFSFNCIYENAKKYGYLIHDILIPHISLKLRKLNRS